MGMAVFPAKAIKERASSLLQGRPGSGNQDFPNNDLLQGLLPVKSSAQSIHKDLEVFSESDTRPKQR